MVLGNIVNKNINMSRKYESCPDNLIFLLIKCSKKNKIKNRSAPKTFLPIKINDNSGGSMTRKKQCKALKRTNR